MKTLLTIMVMVLMNVSCITNENKAKQIDTAIEIKGQVNGKKLGLNEDKEIILQEESNAADELMVVQAVNVQLQSDLDNESFNLKKCRTEISDPRLGGSGEIPPLAEVDNMKSTDDVKEEIGLNEEGELKVVKKEYFMGKLKLERSYEKSLRKMIKTIQRHREECEYKMGIARRKAGLPGSRYQGEGYFKDGAWVQTKPNEGCLDDAFEIQAKEKKNATQEQVAEEN